MTKRGTNWAFAAGVLGAMALSACRSEPGSASPGSGGEPGTTGGSAATSSGGASASSGSGGQEQLAGTAGVGASSAASGAGGTAGAGGTPSVEWGDVCRVDLALLARDCPSDREAAVQWFLRCGVDGAAGAGGADGAAEPVPTCCQGAHCLPISTIGSQPPTEAAIVWYEPQAKVYIGTCGGIDAISWQYGMSGANCYYDGDSGALVGALMYSDVTSYCDFTYWGIEGGQVPDGCVLYGDSDYDGSGLSSVGYCRPDPCTGISRLTCDTSPPGSGDGGAGGSCG